MKKLCLLLWCLLFLNAAYANDNNGPGKAEKENDSNQGQKQEATEASPNFPGSLRIGFALSFLRDAPEDMKLGWWKSRSVDIYYILDLPLGNSRFTFNPGIGLGIERFGFMRPVAFDRISEQEVQIVNIDALNPSKSLLNANYLDIPLELKYHFGATMYSGFNIAVGGRVGYLIDAKTKVNYEENGSAIKLKTKDDFNLNKLRYGVTARVGLGRFNLFYYQNLSPLFKSNQGPSSTDMYHFKAGISFSAF
ncbi:MAG: PorT family protein [Bacteroidota bacterium]|nr:PorT family protein [Bacteroidota bacterium]